MKSERKMKFSVKPCCSGKARLGLLQLANYPWQIETPALLLSTRKGLPLFLTPDLLSSLPSPDSHLLQTSPLHFIDSPSPKAMSNIGGLHQMLGLDEYGFAAAPRDSILCLPEWDGTNKIGASFETPSGRRLISPVDYVKMIASTKPDLWVTLADEVPAWVSAKRNMTSVDRTLKWLDECITLCPGRVLRMGIFPLPEHPKLSWGHIPLEHSLKANGAIFGAIVGGSNLGERKRCAKEVAKRNISGYWIGGFGLAESIDERSALLNAVTDHLQDERPRQICGLGLPDEVLMGVAAGIDLFDSTYIYDLTIEGFGLTFPLDQIDPRFSDSHQSNSVQDSTKINLKATIYRKDTTPIVAGCICYTCENHTKAYIHHLLNAHEMLAQILLEVHNTHHYLGFFRAIRHGIKCGKFEQLHKMFIDARCRQHASV